MTVSRNTFVIISSPVSVADSGGGAKFFALLPPPLPTESRRLSETTENFCYYPPPPLNRVDMALHTKGGPLFRKILDLRLGMMLSQCERSQDSNPRRDGGDCGVVQALPIRRQYSSQDMRSRHCGKEEDNKIRRISACKNYAH